MCKGYKTQEEKLGFTFAFSQDWTRDVNIQMIVTFHLRFNLDRDLFYFVLGQYFVSNL